MTTTIRRDETARVCSWIRSGEISPELVLVDPELARLARAALSEAAEAAEAAESAAVAQVLTIVVEPPRERAPATPLYYALDPLQHTAPNLRATAGRRKTMLGGASRLVSITAPAIFFGSLLVNLALAGALLGGGEAPQLVPAPLAPVEPSGSHLPKITSASATVVRGAHRTRTRTRATRRAIAKTTVERTVLSLVQTAPRSRIAALIDERTGLLKNNVQAVCRRSAASRTVRFLCVVKPVGARSSGGLYIRYTSRPGGSWSLTWLGHRKTGRT